MKAFDIKIVVLLGPVLLAIMGINYSGDPARLSSDRYEERMAAIIGTGRSVTNVSNYDARAFQKAMVRALLQHLMYLSSSGSCGAAI